MGIHDGHRDRVRSRYLHEGIDHFEPHQILELLLFYAIPRKDTNELAHALLERFGTLSGVFGATVDELMNVPGMGRTSAVFLNLVANINRVCAIEELDKSGRFDTLADIGVFLQKLYTGVHNERVYMLLFDNSMRMIDCYLAADGSVNCAQVQVRLLAEEALLKHASCAVLAHNHPGGVALPSQADRDLSEQIGAVFDVLGIPVLEHIIVTEKGFAPILRNSRGVLRASPLTGEIDESFYLHFYQEKQK